MKRTRVTASLLAVAFTATMAAGGPPVGDECEDCIPIGEGAFSGDTCDNAGDLDDSSCALGDTIDEWYCYTPSMTGLGSASFCSGSGTADFNTTLAVFDACGSAELVCNSNTCGNLSEVSWAVSAGTTYFIRIAGVLGACGTYTLDVSVGCLNDTDCPAGQVCIEGDCVAPPFTVSWYTIDCGGGGMSGSSGCGDCAQQNPDGDPGCSDPVCQDIVCVLDAFCCDVVWDGLCAEQALANCDCGSVFALSATIGQADAGVLSGGEFVLAGGFWGAGVAVVSCPWDCGDGDGLVGIVDFLELLAQWDIVGTSCDFDGGGVGIVDFLKLLAQWGPCD